MKKVLTFGVYDILHLGHINLFRKAKLLGDSLLVAVQDGNFIKKYKPEAQMVNSTDERIMMVASIRYVDDVIIYRDVDEDIKNIEFDIFAKGPDQNHAGFRRAVEWCEQKGKTVVTIPRTEGISSTMLREFLDIINNRNEKDK